MKQLLDDLAIDGELRAAGVRDPRPSVPSEPMITTAGWDLERYRPVGKRLVVWLDPGVQALPSGLVLPPDAQEIRSTGIVMCVSDEVPAADFRPGMRVLVTNTAGLSLGWLKNTPVNLYEVGDIQAVLEPDDES